jgi:hypothetical protein
MLLLVAPWACSFDASGVPVEANDLQAEAAAGLDHTAGADSAVAEAATAFDLGAPGDTSRPDAGHVDSEPTVDATAKPDSSQTPDTKPATTCAAKYGAVASYKLCQETATDCTFFHKAADSCSSICSKYKGTCLKAEWDTNDTCTVSKTVACSDYQGDGLCTCTK